MITDTPYITYILPKSRPSQAILGRQPAKAVEGIRRFLSNYTNARFDEPSSIEIVVYSPWDKTEHGLFIDNLIDKTVSLFGPYKQEPMSFHYPSGEPSKQQKYSWHIPELAFEKALQFIVQGHPWPKYSLGPIELITSYHFQLIKNLDQSQQVSLEMKSNLLVWYSSNSCCNATINFPFSTPGREFKSYFDKLSADTPFKMESKYLRLVTPNKTKTNHILSKIVI